ncbi:class I SAM-dependent methyltransferase [Luteimicrobium sp. NPDC057192]|uniref:class I SAM-dependent methyltransferase n=1 Tax=Luteimicrobium sp. NPDC057192 TaxID=3346042 RepID=UPI0036331B11
MGTAHRSHGRVAPHAGGRLRNHHGVMATTGAARIARIGKRYVKPVVSDQVWLTAKTSVRTFLGRRIEDGAPPRGDMHYLDFLRELHTVVQPATYLEIGVRWGSSLALSRTRSLGIDPAYNITSELDLPLRLERTTSDEYFAREDACRWLGGPVEMAFIDGMHLFEYALRDFINVERHSRRSSVIVFDDMLPRTTDEAAREKHTDSWTGDVYHVHEVLRQERPDLTLIVVDTAPTGLLLVTNLDAESTVLEDRYDEFVAAYSSSDPQPVPRRVLDRQGARHPAEVLASPAWEALRAYREASPPLGAVGFPHFESLT